MNKKMFCVAAAAALLATRAGAQIQSPDRLAAQKKTAQYWQSNYGYPQNAYVYNISLETQDLDGTEAKINKLAEAAGIPLNTNQQYMYGRSAVNRMLSFNTTVNKAEAFCQKVIGVAKLKQYSNYSSLNDNTYNETKKKAESVGGELEQNKGLFEKLPIASILMNDLMTRYKGFLAAYEANKEKASISITLSVKQQPQQTGE